MTPEDRDRRLVSVLEDFHRRKALGESPAPEEYRARLGDLHDEFVRLVEAGEAIDRAKTSSAEMTLPRPFGPYLLERVLGGGGMGIVYEAFHRDLARRVAVKVLPRSLETNAASVERFRREARACAQVRHPNVVTVHEAGEADGHLYYAMELVEGKTLQAHIDEHSVPAPRALFAAIADVADALEALHRAGVVHRDVKPSNLIVRPDATIVLADFGLARTFTAPGLTQTGEALGTPPYMSPEQLLGRVRDVDARTDVYGLGATIYHALAGAPPFAARETQDLVRMVLVQRPDALSRRRDDVPAEVEVVVSKALEKRKEDRYTTAGDLRDDLRRVAAGSQPVGRPVPAWRLAARAARLHLVPVAVAVAVLVGAGAWWVAWRESHRPARIQVSIAVGRPVEFVLAGEPRGTTGLGETVVVADVAPGGYSMSLRVGGEETPPSTLHLAAGQTKSLTLPDFGLAQGEQADSADALDRLLTRLSKVIGDWGRLERSRAPTFTEPVALLPRGPVRLADAAVLEVEIPEVLESDERYVVVVRGKDRKKLVPDIPLDAARGARLWATVLPPQVLSALAPGDVVEWSVRAEQSERRPRPGGDSVSATTARFTVIADDPSKDLARADAVGVAESPRVRALLRSRVLLGHGLPTAAARELLAWTPPTEGRTLHEWAGLRQALYEAGGTHLQDSSAVFGAAVAALEAQRDTPLFAKRFPPDR